MTVDIDKMMVDKMTVGKMMADKMTTEKMTVDSFYNGGTIQFFVGKVDVAEI